jgi:nucleoside-triphosphatase
VRVRFLASSETKRLLLLAGDPGIGKTTVLLKVVEALKARGYRVGGMVSREVRSYGSRVGFEILDLTDGRSGWLAHVNQKTGPQVGKYRVNLKDLNTVGADSIVRAVDNSDVVAIDEIGPMELFSENFREAVKRVVESGKLAVGVIHWKARHSLIDEVRARKDVEVFRVTYGNRENLDKTIIKKAVEFLESSYKKKAL